MRAADRADHAGAGLTPPAGLFPNQTAMVAIGWRQAAPKMIFAITVCPDHPPANDAGPCLWVSVSVTRPIAAGTHSRSEEHTSELQSLMRISYAVFCLKKKTRSRTIRPSTK